MGSPSSRGYQLDRHVQGRGRGGGRGSEGVGVRAVSLSWILKNVNLRWAKEGRCSGPSGQLVWADNAKNTRLFQCAAVIPGDQIMRVPSGGGLLENRAGEHLLTESFSLLRSWL